MRWLSRRQDTRLTSVQQRSQATEWMRRPPQICWSAGSHSRVRLTDLLDMATLPRPRACLVGLGQTLLERLELVPDAGGQLVADELEPLFDQRELLTPLVGVDRQRAVHVGSVDVEPVKVEVVGGRNDADRRLPAARLVLDAVDNPLEHPAVLAEARPQELAALAAPEPVDEEHLRQLGLVRVLAQVDPVLEVVAAVVAQEWHHA